MLTALQDSVHCQYIPLSFFTGLLLPIIIINLIFSLYFQFFIMISVVYIIIVTSGSGNTGSSCRFCAVAAGTVVDVVSSAVVVLSGSCSFCSDFFSLIYLLPCKLLS